MISSFELRLLALDLSAANVFMLTAELLVWLRPTIVVGNGTILPMYIVIPLAIESIVFCQCLVVLLVERVFPRLFVYFYFIL